MKRTIKLFGVLILSIVVLSACSSGEDADQSGSENSDTKETDTYDGNNDQSSEDEGDSSEPASTNDENNTKDDNKGEKNSSGSFDDQLDLGIGDTGKVDSSIGKYETTLKSAKIKKKINGKESGFDYFIVVQLEVKNIGDEKLKAEDAVGSLELTENKEATGSGIYEDFDGIDLVQGEIAPGETAKGKEVFDAYQGKEYYLIDGKGMSTIQNKVIWTFKADEAK